MKRIIMLAAVLMACANFSFSQENATGPIVQTPIYFDVSPPLRDMVQNLPGKAETSWKEGVVKNKFNVRQKPKGDNAGGMTDPNLQTMNGVSVTTDTTLVNFDGNTNTEGYIPPDTHGDVGPNHYFQVVNCHYSIYSKTGTLLLGPLANSSVFTGMPNNSNDGDAVVLYDEQADRWLFTQFSLPGYPNGPFYQMIAVSQTGDPTGSWYRYEYSFTNMPDYPKFGVWGDGYYMSMHLFSSGSLNYAGIGAVAYNRSLMLTGSAAATMIMFTKGSTDEAFGWLPSDCDGPFPTGNPPNYFLYSYDGASNDHLGIYEFHVDWTTTANSTFANFLSLPVNAFAATMTGVTQLGSSVKLDVINDRMMYRLQYRAFNGYSAMVCNHTVDVSSSIAGIRWYELRKTTGAWSIYQQGTYTVADNNSRWMGSIAMDSSGNMALGYSVAGTALYPSIRYTGRKKNDPLNMMTIAEKGIYNGAGAQTSSYARWGDYSALSCDPSAKATYWYTTEYMPSTSSTGWKTRIASFKWASNPIVATAAVTNLSCTGATLNGSVNPNGLATNYHFEWGTTTSYGNSTPVLAAGSGTTTINVNATLSGLTAGTTYHYRIVAVNTDGTSNGLDMTFAPCTAMVVTTSASSITMTSASSGGNVTTDGGSPVTARGVCWATTANPTIAGNHTTDGSGTGTFTSSIAGLTSNTTYHVRAYATNNTGTSYGADLSFTTLCGTYTPPFAESFTNTTIPTCWTQIDNQGNGQIWQFGVITGQTPLPALTGNYAFLNSRGYGAGNSQNADLITPVIDMTGYINVTLSYKQYFRQSTGSSGTLSYSIDGGSTWTTIATFTVTSTTNPENMSYPIAALSGQSAVKFKWNYTGTYGRYWGIDDISVTGTASSPTLSVTPPNQNVSNIAGNTSFTVASNTSWAVSSDQAWCTVTPSGTGNGTITATYTENTATTPRVANITVNVSSLPPVVVTVTQAAAPLSIAVVPPNQNVAYQAGATNFNVTSNAAWTVASDQAWCTATPSGSGNGTITATYLENPVTTPRVANLTVTVTGLAPVVVTVTQDAAPFTLAVVPPNQNVSAPAGTTNFSVTSNTDWTLLSDQSWCTVPAGGSGAQVFTATYEENTTVATRTADITVTVTGLPPVVVTVTQAGTAPILAVMPPNQNVPALPGITDFTITSNTTWTVLSDQAWCQVTSGGSGNGTITATYIENTSVTGRVANISVTGDGFGTVVVTVSQAGAAPVLMVSPPNLSVPYAAGTAEYSVTSNTDWFAVSDAAWCTVTPSGSGNGTLSAIYEQNTSQDPRQAVITVSVTGISPISVTLSQEGMVGMGDLTRGDLIISPNPSDGKFSLSSRNHGIIDVMVQVTDIRGKTLETLSCSGKERYTFDLSGYAKGCYLLKATTGESTRIYKVVIE